MTLFISCIQGLEDVLASELAALGYSCEKARAGVYVPFKDFNQIYELNFALRCASRVLLPLHKFVCKNKEDLYKEASQIDWRPFFKKNLPTFAIDSVVHHNKSLTNSLFAAQVLKDAICDQIKSAFGARPSVDTQDPQVSIHLFILENEATISFDTSGVPLHVRGYRLEGGKAPLRESLAAALLYLAGFKEDDFVVDPCCGSATILIEAALMASHTAPGLFRGNFGHFSHPEFSEDEFRKVRSSIAKKKRKIEKRFFGIEKHKFAASNAQKTIRRVHLEGVVEVVEGDFRSQTLPFEPNFVLTNPPYGVRLETTEALQDLYSDLGRFLKEKTKKPARGAILTGNLELAKCIGLKTSKRHIVNNGGIECRLLEYDLY